MGLEQWGASEQYVAVIHKVLPRKSVFILKNQDYRFLFLREDIKEMEKSNIMIRLEKKEEQRKVENLVRDSFGNVYRPGCLEHYVLHQLIRQSELLKCFLRVSISQLRLPYYTVSESSYIISDKRFASLCSAVSGFLE